MPLRPRSSPRTAGPLRTALIAALLASGLSACGLVGSEAASTTTSPPTSTSTTAPPVAASEPPRVLDPGAEPRTALRMAYTEGQTATISFTSDLAVDQGAEADAPAQGIDSPPINQTLTYTVGAVTDQGAQLTMEITDVAVRSEETGLSDAEVQALQAELDPLVGITGTGTITSLGELQDLSFALPGDLDEALQAQLATLDQQITGLGPALPSEPVGVGARWSVASTSDAGGPEVRTETTYELTGLADGQLDYTAAIASSAEPQELDVAGLPKGTTAALRSSELTGTTEGTLLLDRPGFTLDTRLSGPQVLELTAADGTTSTVHQEIRLAYRAATAAG